MIRIVELPVLRLLNAIVGCATNDEIEAHVGFELERVRKARQLLHH